MTDWILKAKDFAGEKHAKQKYGNHPYMYHLEEVFSLGKQMDLSEELLMVAILHDTIEDTNTFWFELCEIFGSFVGETVYCLSKQDHECYEDYILRVSKNKNAKKIKILDLLCNLKNSYLMEDCERKERLIAKYQTALFFLSSN